MPLAEITKPGTGAKYRPQHLKNKDVIFSAIIPVFDWTGVKEDSILVGPDLFGIPDKDQGGSLSCTAQTMGYGFRYVTGVELSREDIYAHTKLPGGGAYLNAPLDWLRKNGYVLLSKYPDPNPETEQNMSQIITVQDGDRIRTFQLTYTFYTPNLNSTAAAITNHNYVHLGIKGSWTKGWENSWVDPYYGQDDWAHALFAGKESIVLRNGIPAIKAKSSWTQHKDPQGQQVFCHYLNSSYFSAGGCFETIGVDIIEVTNMTDAQLGQLWQAVFKRPIDTAGLAFYHGKTLDEVLAGILASKENTEYAKIFQAVKSMENDVRSGQF